MPVRCYGQMIVNKLKGHLTLDAWKIFRVNHYFLPSNIQWLGARPHMFFFLLLTCDDFSSVVPTQA